MAARSPINFIDRIKAPVLLAQGANDVIVTRQESDQIAKALYNRNMPVEYILAENEGHGFSRQENVVAEIQVVEAFLGKHLGGGRVLDPSDEEKEHLKSLRVDISEL